jgi:hypothetical protein
MSWRLFGKKKEAPAPTLADAEKSLQARGTAIDEQIKKLDQVRPHALLIRR